MKYPFLLLMHFLFLSLGHSQGDFLIEAETFTDKGGWVVDPQFIEQMGSSYIMAHGMGSPVRDASTSITLTDPATYHVYVRTKNWVPGNWEAPGKFLISINSKQVGSSLGLSPEWGWEYAGEVALKKGSNKIQISDLTGFNGRCDAIYFNTERSEPPQDLETLTEWRKGKLKESEAPSLIKDYDLVVTGGGIAGCAAAIAAAEEGLRVALIHDRPVLGGNASSEIRVHTLGIYGKFERILRKIDTEHYPNGSAEAIKDQEKRDENVKSYKNIDLHLNWRAYDAHSVDETIEYVDARHTASGDRIRFTAPLFVDATGDAWIGYWAGADYSYGRESVDKYGEGWDKWGELWSPEEADNVVMGSSILFQTSEKSKTSSFPSLPWAEDVAQNHAATAGEWYWEFSRNDLHQIYDAEEIRDHMLRAIFGSFSNAKKEDENKYYSLDWVSYLVGKRESRRLIGDHVFTFNDVTELRKFPDSVVQEIREVDIHFQQNLQDEEKPDFLSKALFYKTPKYYIPYRSLYSRNINNLFMAGRNFSCSHVGLGGPRVMKTTGQMGAAVGFAASICKKYGVNPREVYEKHLLEYMRLIEEQKYLKP